MSPGSLACGLASESAQIIVIRYRNVVQFMEKLVQYVIVSDLEEDEGRLMLLQFLEDFWTV